MIRFTCNVCSQSDECPEESFARERATCSGCGSTVRFRVLMHLLSVELFGLDLTLEQFPRLKSIRGLGLSDWEGYADVLAEKFDYTNTFLNQEPRFDIRMPSPSHYGEYDFIISAEVFEHVEPPVERVFREACQLLKPHGVLILTVPYSLEATTREHFPELHQYALAELNGSPVLVNRTREGKLEVFEHLVFHGGPGSMLEMRVFNDASLKEMLLAAGFREVEICSRSHPSYGVVFREQWGLPVVARKGPVSHTRTWAAEMIRQIDSLRQFRKRVEAAERIAKERTEWAQRLDGEIVAAKRRISELQEEVEQQNQWARGLDLQVSQQAFALVGLLKQLRAANSSRWVALGRLLGLGPRFTLDG
ncbi:MAG: methyltransferase domain-containing protein [Bryobacteraceae bacterium]|jgi:SAM-dependent methyltransferase